MAIWTAQTEYACGWTLDDEACVPCKGKIPGEAAPDEEKVTFQNCVNVAAEILYALSGRQFGLCELTVRPCRTDCCDPCDQGGYRWTPALVGGQWTNVSCGGCGDTCSCTKVCDVRLPGPIDSIVEVKLDGEVLPADSYRVDNRRDLVALKRPQQILGDFQVAFSGLDPSAVITVDVPATSVEWGTALGNNQYGPDGGIIRLTWRGLDCVNVTYDGPGDTRIATARPAASLSEPGEAWTWPDPGFDLAVDTPVVSSIHDDESSVLATLVSGTAVTSNANPGPRARNITVSPGTVIEFCPSQLLPFCWPTCQDMNADSTEDGTWEVTYMRGRPVPAGGRAALAELACELCLACLNDDCCRLPSRVTSLTREGVSMALLDPMDFVDKGLVGLYGVDLWLRAVNPKGRSRRGAILSPDALPTRKTTWQV